MQFSAGPCAPGALICIGWGWHGACHQYLRWVGGSTMSHQTRQCRRPIYRIPRERYAWKSVSRFQARRALAALYRRAGA